jgi:hypothetical protein
MNPYLKLEQPLIDLKTMAGLLEHMATSDRTSDCGEFGQELGHIQLVLMECHEDISSVRDALVEAKEAAAAHASEVAELRAELAAVKASKAPPGSWDDVENAKAHWMLLLSAARTMLASCEEAGALPVAHHGHD